MDTGTEDDTKCTTKEKYPIEIDAWNEKNEIIHKTFCNIYELCFQQEVISNLNAMSLVWTSKKQFDWFIFSWHYAAFPQN